MKKPLKTDYVIYDRFNDRVLMFENSGDIVIFGTKEEAEEDCRGNEIVIRCTDLPNHHQQTIIKQINRA